MLSNLKTFLDSIKLELSLSRRKTYEVQGTGKEDVLQPEDPGLQGTGSQRHSVLDHLDVLEEIGRGCFWSGISSLGSGAAKACGSQALLF